MQKNHNVNVGDILEIAFMGDRGRGVVLGIVDDLKIQSLRADNNMNLFFVINFNNTIPRYSYIKISEQANVNEVMNYIENTISDIDPSFPVKMEFYDVIFNRLYKNEIELGTTIKLFSLLSIIISVIGVFGLVMFECKARQKEISIRKVLGSSELEVVHLLNNKYALILIVSMIIAIPISYYIVDEWLTNFAYKTSIDWWVFLLAGAIVSIITIVTVSIQTYRAASINPIKYLVNE